MAMKVLAQGIMKRKAAGGRKVGMPLGELCCAVGVGCPLTCSSLFQSGKTRIHPMRSTPGQHLQLAAVQFGPHAGIARLSDSSRCVCLRCLAWVAPSPTAHDHAN